MVLLLELTLFKPGVKLVGGGHHQVNMVASPEDASVIAWQYARSMPPGCDMHAQLYEVDLEKKTVAERALQKVQFIS